MQAFSRNITALINENVWDAAVAQTNLLLSVMNNWRSEVLAPAEWDGLRFVSTTSHMADDMNLVSQV
jgi:hypothetical protein